MVLRHIRYFVVVVLADDLPHGGFELAGEFEGWAV
jgi:hypothetical protein